MKRSIVSIRRVARGDRSSSLPPFYSAATMDRAKLFISCEPLANGVEHDGAGSRRILARVSGFRLPPVPRFSKPIQPFGFRIKTFRKNSFTFNHFATKCTKYLGSTTSTKRCYLETSRHHDIDVQYYARNTSLSLIRSFVFKNLIPAINFQDTSSLFENA